MKQTDISKLSNSSGGIPAGKRQILTKPGFLKDITKNPFSYLIAMPAMIYTLIYGYLTLPYMIIAFQRFDYSRGIFHSQWVGLKNLEFFIKSMHFTRVTWNTLSLNFLFIVVTTLISIIIALLLNEVRHRLFLRVTQSAFLLPHFISWIIVSIIVYQLLSVDKGIVNKILSKLGYERIRWYDDAKAWTWILVIIKVWKGAGVNIIIYLAAITGIDNSLYEAATIDGANRFQQAKNITLPLLMPTVSILTLLSIGRIFYGDFAMIYSIVRDNGLLFATTDVIDTYVFRTLRLNGNPASAMAVGLFQSVLGFIFIFGSNAFVKKHFKDGALF